jgi:hypothetical protein
MSLKPLLRTIRVGSTGVYVWGRITESTGEDVSGLTPQVRTVSPAGVVSSWAAPVLNEHPSLSVIRCAIQHDAVEVGWWRFEAKVTDNPEVEVLLLGGFEVIP